MHIDPVQLGPYLKQTPVTARAVESPASASVGRTPQAEAWAGQNRTGQMARSSWEQTRSTVRQSERGADACSTSEALKAGTMCTRRLGERSVRTASVTISGGV
jgi:hypothetical protein